MRATVTNKEKLGYNKWSINRDYKGGISRTLFDEKPESYKFYDDDFYVECEPLACLFIEKFEAEYTSLEELKQIFMNDKIKIMMIEK